jgi:hypothetical protein
MCSEVERPDEFGGGRLEIVSMASGLGPGLDGNLCAFCIGALDEPEWVARISDEPPERNELLSGPLSGSYTIEVYYTRDVFPQSPGDEIICLYHDWTWSASVLRIYDLRGKVLFEAWHNGWLHSAEWFPALGVLVASGVNSDAMRYQRGEHGGESYPLVVFAIKPELGKTGRWITTPARSGGIDPLWYKCLLPSSATNPLHDPHLDISADPEHAGTIRAYCNGIINEVRTAVVGLDINTEGEVVGRMVWDQYRQLRGGSEEAMPDPDELRLGDLPPIVVQRRPAGTAPAK